jgi:hypothetical protein
MTEGSSDDDRGELNHGGLAVATALVGDAAGDHHRGGYQEGSYVMPTHGL